MLLKRLKLVNYGGIYNGLGLKEIEIDFTKCQHRIILIKGDNGSGKSTIESALKPLPDDNSAFIADENAYKEIEYIDEISGAIYSIRFEHEIAGNKRKSRGFISKSCGGFISQLNPSGNISSCKDIIYDELQLDPNFITLSQLSATKRGIADLRPTERKKYVNSILENTDAYNDMYKTLSKKASTYKGMVQSITAKLDTIGNVAQLEETIKRLDNQIQDIEDMIERHNEIMNKEKGMLQSTDPDNKLRERIEYLNTTLAEYQEKRATNDKELRKIYVKYPELATLIITPNMISELNAKVIEMSNLASSYKSKIAVLIESRRVDSEELQVKTAKLKSINSAGTLYEVKKLKQELNKKKNDIESRWGRVIDVNSITSSEFLSIYEIILEMIDIVCSTNVVLDVDGEYRKTNLAIKEIEDKIDEVVNINNRISLYEDKVYILEQRPATCTDNTCPFIADAIDAKKMLDKWVEDRRKTKESLTNLSKNKDSLNDYLFTIEKSRQLRNMYSANIRVLRLLNFGFDTFESTVHELNTKANMIKSVLRGVLDYTNDIEEYKKITQSLSDIENKFHALSSQEDFINMITTDIAKLEYQIAEDNNTIEKLNADLATLDKEFTRITGIISTYTSILEYNKIINECMEAIKILEDEIEENKANIDRIQKINSDIEKLTVNLSELKSQLKPIKEKRDSLAYKLNVSIEYDKELKQYSTMYEKIDTLKYFCSPTTGIQLLFANMYLSRILEKANRILGSLFGGIFALLPLVVTENEFRIPVAVNGGINHDDITSMSSAQISLISMIISIALLSQTSTKLNIIIGDEIDAPFDSENRREFITILYQLMSMVNASQCVLISHNSEISMDDCDIILLKSDNDIITTGNIIWSYR